jgi:hypothetical protein
MISAVVCEAVTLTKLRWDSTAFAIDVTEFVADFKLNTLISLGVGISCLGLVFEGIQSDLFIDVVTSFKICHGQKLK